MPLSTLPLKVTAFFDNGASEDVTRWVKYTAGNNAVATVDDVAFPLSRTLEFREANLEVGTLVNGLSSWMAEHEYKSVRQMKGSLSQKSVENPTAFERANYIKIIEKYKGEYQAV